MHPMPLHGGFLVGQDAKVASGLSRAQEDEARLSIGAKVTQRLGLVEFALQDLSSAAQTPALQTGVRQLEPRSSRRIPYRLVCRDLNSHNLLVRRNQFDGIPCVHNSRGNQGL